ncbi:MAG: deoxyguanosinetriphosphate triphosphohydrolase [Deltaproteobacteria bacterium]|nr:deoxyguanosinetriphosphate triphosphohydrolase [Deltaproteobacteria bacterium]
MAFPPQITLAGILAREESALSPHAALSRAATRLYPEDEPSPYRAPFQLDRDKIVQTRAFRRLAHKTQVFPVSAGDHYRTRLTHTLEVSQIARTVARALGLNEDLAEAISMGHDLGHAPFGHAGERVLNRLCPGGFRHQEQSLRIVDALARDGAGLNLTLPVRDGILKHSKGQGPILVPPPAGPSTYEGLAVRVADILAYLAHDMDDALEADLLRVGEIPISLLEAFGETTESRENALISDLLLNSRQTESELSLAFSPQMLENMTALREFLFLKVYRHPKVVAEMDRGAQIIEKIWKAILASPELYRSLPLKRLADTQAEAIKDFIAGMTDRFALNYLA